MISHPFGALQIAGGSDTVALTTTAALLDSFSTTGGEAVSGSYSADGDPAIKADVANNRILVNTPGVYKVTAVVSLDLATGADVELGVRKNGAAVSNLVGRARCTTDKGQVTLTGLVVVARTDSPGTLKTFDDPASTGFAGAGGAPKTLCALDLTLRCLASTDTATVEAAQFIVERLN